MSSTFFTYELTPEGNGKPRRCNATVVQKTRAEQEGDVSATRRRFGPGPRLLAAMFASGLAVALVLLANPTAGGAASQYGGKPAKKHRCVRRHHGKTTYRHCAKKHKGPKPIPVGPPAPNPPTDRGAAPTPPVEAPAAPPVESPGEQPGG